MYAYTRDKDGHYVGVICGERVTAHNREQFNRLARQAELRVRQRRAISDATAAKRGLRRLSWT